MKKVIDTRKLLFENMAKLNPDFKPSLNEKIEPQEHQDEGASNKAKLEELVELAKKAYKNLPDNEIPSWVQDNITIARERIDSICGWLHAEEEDDETDMEGEHREMDAEEEDELDEAKKEKKWIQKAVDPKHKGYCTPMTKPTCTPRRKVLAKRFKKGIEDEAYGTPDPLGTNMAKQINEEDSKSLVTYGSKIHSDLRQVPELKRVSLYSHGSGIAGLYLYNHDNRHYEIDVRPAELGTLKSQWTDILKNENK